MLSVALTGGIASGKSTVANRFRELGVPVLDMDQVARQVVRKGSPGLRALVEHFGPDMLQQDGTLDRTRLRQRIFEDETARERVNTILHPLIREATHEQLKKLEAPYAIVEVPLLAETGTARDFDRVVVVDLPIALQRERLAARDEQSEQQIDAILAAQATREQRLAIATDVLDNSGTRDAMFEQVDALHDQLTALAKRFATKLNGASE